MQYDVSWEATGFTFSADADQVRLSDEQLSTFTGAKLPAGVLAVKQAYVTTDDAQNEDDIRIFIRVTLLVEAASVVHAEKYAAPLPLLAEVVEQLATDECLEGDLDVDLSSWELTDVEETAA